MPRLALLVLLASLLASPIAHAEDPPEPAASRPGASWAGVWRLDHDASDSIEEMLVVMKAPWLARKAAALATPTLTISPRDHGGLQVVNENPVRSSTQEIFVDGIEREGKDALDRKVIRSATWNDAGQLVSTSRNYVEPDEPVNITSTWSLRGDTLEISNAVPGEDGPLYFTRVFRKQ